MSQPAEQWTVERVAPESLYSRLREIAVFANLQQVNLQCLHTLEVVRAAADAVIVPEDEPWRSFWVLLEGQVTIWKRDSASSAMLPIAIVPTGEAFGELPILAAAKPGIRCVTNKPSVLVRFSEEGFWQLMFSCPQVRGAVLGNMAKRLEGFQAQAVHREKLAALGTLAAGLMHELNNPGAAARRAASQLRENLLRLQGISLRMTRMRMSAEQLECVVGLQEKVFSTRCCRAMGSMEQSDAEEALSEWLEGAGVENAWQLSPALVATGLDQETLSCAQGVFRGSQFSDVLNWLGALVMSVQLVGTVEESITRVSDLAMAVKRYSYEGKGNQASVDVHESLQSTLVILGHKLKSKQLTVQREFAPGLPPVELAGSGLNQVWTNLLDNAIDASPESATIRVRTWNEDEKVFVAIQDSGGGIPKEDQSRIFEPFFTTKPAGYGTGLGLDIVQRIVVQQMGGEVRVSSVPGNTEFTVALPVRRPKGDSKPDGQPAHA